MTNTANIKPESKKRTIKKSITKKKMLFNLSTEYPLQIFMYHRQQPNLNKHINIPHTQHMHDYYINITKHITNINNYYRRIMNTTNTTNSIKLHKHLPNIPIRFMSIYTYNHTYHKQLWVLYLHIHVTEILITHSHTNITNIIQIHT